MINGNPHAQSALQPLTGTELTMNRPIVIDTYLRAEALSESELGKLCDRNNGQSFV